MTQNFLDNTLYEMDNLIVLRGMNSETIDLIATDPPFNTKRNREGTAGQYEDKWVWLKDLEKRPDQWKWNEIHPKWLEEIQDNHKALHAAIKGAEECQGKDTAAFLCFLSVRLLEMHRILKPTGSIYLHCDATVSHYIKTCMDALFGKQNFRNEIVWKKYSGRKNNATRKFSTQSDSIFFYVKSKDSYFQPIYVPISEKEIEKEYRHTDENGRVFRYSRGRHYQLTGEQRRIYLDEQPGSAIGTLWVEDGLQLNTSSNERTGSPDQKPVSLYERIIQASSKEGDLVLDPFCGCATTIIAANNLKRRWIGIDRRTDARYHIVTRLLGLSRKDRERLKKNAINEEWLEKQIQSCEMHYQSEPPKRTDNGEKTTPELKQVYSAEPENLLSHDQMKKTLINEFGVECWGCGFQPPDNDDRYLHLDHINPKSSGGSNDIDNRSILCQPCNSKKLNRMTLDALRRENKREKRMKKDESQLIDLVPALTWTRNHMLEIRERNPKQYSLFRNKT